MIVNQTKTFSVRHLCAEDMQKPASQRRGKKGKESDPFRVVSFDATPPVIYSIEHQTHYTYTAPISHSKHLLRLQPVQDRGQTLLDYKCEISVNQATVSNFIGVFGNSASFIEIKKKYSELTITSRSTVALTPIQPNMKLAHQPRTMPVIWMPWDRTMMQAYLQPPELAESELFELSDYAMSFVRKNHNDVFEVLKDMTETIYRDYTYTSGSTTLETTPYIVYTTKKGVCQDFANLLICLARLLDIPARYRTGYIYTGNRYENEAQADATHAWVEVFLPYLGWIGFDPTNGCLVDHNHIRVACGRYYRDATPTSGAIFKAHGEIEETLATSVKVIRLPTT